MANRYSLVVVLPFKWFGLLPFYSIGYYFIGSVIGVIGIQGATEPFDLIGNKLTHVYIYKRLN